MIDQTQNQNSEPQQEIKQDQAKAIEQRPRSAIQMNEEGWLIGANLEERFRVADAWFKSKMVPASYENSIQVLGAMEFSIQLGIPPLIGLSKIAIINGQPSIWGEMPLALVRKSGHLKSIKEVIYDKDGKLIDLSNPLATPFLAGCEVHRIDGSSSCTFFSMDDARNAGLLGRNNPWKSYPRRMLQMRARSQSLKDLFPDVLMGVPVSEYDFNHIPDGKIRTVNPNGEEKRDAAQELSKAITGGEISSSRSENT